MDLRRVDLNLLLVFEALAAEQSVSRAADRIGRSQPAVSNALGRLRDLFDDPLFVRTAEGMMPTPRAHEIRPLIASALQNFRTALDGAGFDPLTSTRKFSLVSADAGAAHLLSRLLPMLRKQAPNVTLTLEEEWANEALSALSRGSIDFALGVFSRSEEAYHSVDLMVVREVCVADAANTEFAACDLSVERFLTMSKIALQRRDTGNVFLPLLQASGYMANAVLTLPNFLVAARALLGTDLIAVLPEVIIEDMPDRHRFAVRPLPFQVPDIKVKLAWSPHRNSDAGHAWLRSLMMAACTQ